MIATPTTRQDTARTSSPRQQTTTTQPEPAAPDTRPADPITGEVFSDPVLAPDGVTYERTAVVRWLEEHGGTLPSGHTGVRPEMLYPDVHLRQLLDDSVDCGDDDDVFCDPITMCTFDDPVVASDGRTYSRACLEDIVRRMGGKSPVTREPLAAHAYRNRRLEAEIARREGTSPIHAADPPVVALPRPDYVGMAVERALPFPGQRRGAVIGTAAGALFGARLLQLEPRMNLLGQVLVPSVYALTGFGFGTTMGLAADGIMPWHQFGGPGAWMGAALGAAYGLYGQADELMNRPVYGRAPEHWAQQAFHSVTGWALFGMMLGSMLDAAVATVELAGRGIARAGGALAQGARRLAAGEAQVAPDYDIVDLADGLDLDPD